MSSYGWVILVDHLDGSAVGTKGPHDISDVMSDDLHGRRESKPFNMYDDDGILYYSGLITGDFEGSDPL